MENQNEANDDSHIKTSHLPAALRAFRHYNYRLFFCGQLISLSGAWMQSVAQSWLVYKMTDSAVLLGFIGFSGQIPVFLFAPLGGAIADEYNRQRILIATQVSMMILAFALAWLTLTNQIEVWHVFCLAALGGIASAFDIPTRQSFVADLVGKKDLVNAIALNSSMFNGARIIGPAIAGILVASIGEGWCFFVNGVTYTAVITSLILMKIPSHEKTVLRGSTLDKIREGFVYVGKTHPIRDLLYLLGFVSLIGTPYAVLMPIFADKILNGGASGLGILMGATGVGALAGALSLAMRSGIKGLGRWVAFSCAGFGVSLIAFSLSTSFWLSAFLLIPVGFCMMIQMASSNTLIQSLVSDNFRGRVMAVYSMMFMGMAPLGALIAGAIADKFGAPITVTIGGAVCIFGGIAFGLRLPTFRHEAREIIVALQMAGGEPANHITGQSSIAATK